jgi:hypothetical protein
MKFLLQSKQTKDKNGEKNRMNDFYQRKIVVRNGSIEQQREMSAEFRDENLVRVWIPDSISILKSQYFHNFDRFLAISFESNSQLIQIASFAFSNSSLQSIVIPLTVEILGSSCFSYCKSLSSISFESNSHLTRIESEAFYESSLQSIEIRRNVQFIDGSAFIGVTLSLISFESGKVDMSN